MSDKRLSSCQPLPRLTCMSNLYEALGSLLEYPGADWGARVERCEESLTVQEPEVAAQFVGFHRKTGEMSIPQLQELYTQTFDLNPVCTLDIGYHLFGENYKRGELLANLRKTEAPYCLGQENQLPDYLPVLLRLLVKLEDEDLRRSLIVELLIPALDTMLKSLGTAENPYRHVVEVIRLVLGSEVPEAAEASWNSDTAEIPELYRISSKASARADGKPLRNDHA